MLCFSLKYLLWGHLETISFREFSKLLGLERAMCVFSEMHVSQYLAPDLYGTAFDFSSHSMFSNLICSPKSICFLTKLDSLVPFWCLCLTLPRCSFHLSINVRLVIPMQDLLQQLVLTVASYTTLSILHFPFIGQLAQLQTSFVELLYFGLNFLRLLPLICNFRFLIDE